MITFYFKMTALTSNSQKKYASISFEVTRGQKPLENVEIRSYLNYDNDQVRSQN